MNVVPCRVEVTATGRSLVQERHTDFVCVCVTECDRVKQ